MRQYFLKEQELLKKNSQIKRVFDKGNPVRGRLVTIILLEQNEAPGLNRVAFVPTRNSHRGKIVLKNRYKRVIREAYRQVKKSLPVGYDTVILGTNINKHTKSTEIEKDLLSVFKKISKKYN